MNSPIQFFANLNWLDGRPIADVLEPYRVRLFEQAASRDARGQFLYNLILSGRAKKNWKSSDAMLYAFFALTDDAPQGNDVFIVANDEDQAADDLDLAKKLVRANDVLGDQVTIRRNSIERNDGNGAMRILPAQDAVGMHGKTGRLVVIDEIHGYRTYDVLEGLAPDPTRLDAQTWITSYATIHHRPGVPLFDLMKIGKAGTDPKMLFSWYAADYTTDPDFADATPEARANPSMASWGNSTYLEQQAMRLPSHKFRRLHLNLPGLPDGSAFQPDPVMDAIDRGVATRTNLPAGNDFAYVDMSGGSSDDAVLGIARGLPDGSIVLVRILNQGAPVPFDPRNAVERFAGVLREHGLTTVEGDRYAGETFRRDFERHGIFYKVATKTTSQTYEALEPLMNGGKVRLLDVPVLEQQLLGLVWRGGKIDHPAGEHDDYATACAGAVVAAHSYATLGSGIRCRSFAGVTEAERAFDRQSTWNPSTDTNRGQFGG